MHSKKILGASFLAAFVFGIPFNWLFYKGDQGVGTLFGLLTVHPMDVFYDFSVLFVNTLILYFFIWCLWKKIKPIDKERSAES